MENIIYQTIYLILVVMTGVACHELVKEIFKVIHSLKKSKAETDAEKVVKMKDWRQ